MPQPRAFPALLRGDVRSRVRLTGPQQATIVAMAMTTAARGSWNVEHSPHAIGLRPDSWIRGSSKI